MILDFNELNDGSKLDYDICVVGSGPSAFALALQFAQRRPGEPGSGMRVAILESSPDDNSDVQALYEGENAGLLARRTRWPTNYLTQGRLRKYGGTSNHWGGWSWPFEEFDLKERSIRPGVSWPIEYGELLSYYEKAQRDVMQLDAFAYDDPQYWIDNTPNPKLAAIPLPPDAPLRTRILQFNWFHFQDEYGRVITGSNYVHLYRNANVIGLETEDAGPDRRRVLAMVARGIERGRPGVTLSIRARYFVLAAGGIESTRQLLLFGIGNSSKHLGENFMDHPYLNSATYRVGNIPPEVRNFYLGLGQVDADQLDLKMQSIPAPNGKSTFIAGLVPQHEILEHYCVGNFRVLLGGVGNQPGTIQTNIEPLPQDGGTISLSDSLPCDLFGQQRVKVDWRLSPLARKTGEVMFKVTKEILERLGYGSDFWFPDLDDRVWNPGLHPMGTTRMSAERKDGVVDPKLRVHDSSNLYVASSSVFPTAGYQNPTFTVCALAVRLADHFKTNPTD